MRFVGNGIPRLVERFAPAPERTPEGLARALEEFSERYGAHRADKTAPYAGMPEAVERLRAAGVRTAVLSNKAHALAGPVVEDYYPGQFPWVQGALPGLPTKPDPTLLHRLMEQMDEVYPQYGFAVHKGYGTKRHYEALREFGPSPIHRKTFLKKFYENP